MYEDSFVHVGDFGCGVGLSTNFSLLSLKSEWKIYGKRVYVVEVGKERKTRRGRLVGGHDHNFGFLAGELPRVTHRKTES